MIDKVLEGLIGNISFVYLDDIIIFSEEIESHNDRVKQVIERLKQNGLQLKLKKCEFLKPSIRFLGHVISYGQVEKPAFGCSHINSTTAQNHDSIKKLHGSRQLL